MTSASLEARPPSKTDSLRVLIVDDEHLVALSLRTSMEGLGHEVAGVAADGDQAEALARDAKPDLILMDICMPGATGIEVCKRIYTELGVPSLIVSAYSDDEYLKQITESGEASGVFGYVTKPTTKESLRVAVSLAYHRASIASTQSARITQLEKTLESRRAVEQAKWVMVEKLGMTEPQAHDRLQKSARNSRTPIRDVAQRVIDEGVGFLENA